MTIKKYPQSHLVITSNAGKKLIIDAGDLTFEKGYKTEEFADADVFLITHNHYDHLPEKYADITKELFGNKPIFGNSDVVIKLKTLGIVATEVKNREKFTIKGFEIEPINLPHFRLPEGIKPPPNTGFIIDGVFFHAGDGFELDGLSVNNAALALGHPSLSSLAVLEFAKSLNAKTLIPIHYDSWPRDPKELEKTAKKMSFNIEIRILENGEETAI